MKNRNRYNLTVIIPKSLAKIKAELYSTPMSGMESDSDESIQTPLLTPIETPAESKQLTEANPFRCNESQSTIQTPILTPLLTPAENKPLKKANPFRCTEILNDIKEAVAGGFYESASVFVKRGYDLLEKESFKDTLSDFEQELIYLDILYGLGKVHEETCKELDIYRQTRDPASKQRIAQIKVLLEMILEYAQDEKLQSYELTFKPLLDIAKILTVDEKENKYDPTLLSSPRKQQSSKGNALQPVNSQHY